MKRRFKFTQKLVHQQSISRKWKTYQACIFKFHKYYQIDFCTDNYQTEVTNAGKHSNTFQFKCINNSSAMGLYQPCIRRQIQTSSVQAYFFQPAPPNYCIILHVRSRRASPDSGCLRETRSVLSAATTHCMQQVSYVLQTRSSCTY